MDTLSSTGTTPAWIVVSRGSYSSPSVLKYFPDHPLSALHPDQVRVRMKFASPYKGTTYLWRVIPTWVRTHWFPVAHEIADYEGAGVVEQVYEEEGKEKRLKVGDEVFGVSYLLLSIHLVYQIVVTDVLLNFKVMDPVGKIPQGRGALALHATFLESELTHKPAFLSWEQAAVLNGRVQTGMCRVRLRVHALFQAQ